MFCYYLCVGRMERRAANLPIMTLLSIVYLTYIYRVSIVYLSCIYRVSIVFSPRLDAKKRRKERDFLLREREGFGLRLASQFPRKPDKLPLAPCPRLSFHSLTQASLDSLL